jgi:hypothetical protein
MKTPHTKLRIREAMTADTEPLCDILNTIINTGGMTALDTVLSYAKFIEYFLKGDRVLGCFVAEDIPTGRVLGFQSLILDPDLPEAWSDIGTFTAQDPKTPGVGTALFAQTRIRTEELKLAAINATIRADNRIGLAYYAKMGFQTYKIAKGVPLKDGTPVDRISKSYFVT